MTSDKSPHRKLQVTAGEQAAQTYVKQLFTPIEQEQNRSGHLLMRVALRITGGLLGVAAGCVVLLTQ